MLQEKTEKESLWCIDDTPKGQFGRVSQGIPRDAEIALKDVVVRKFFVDEKGQKQGKCENYAFGLQHTDNAPIDGKGWEKVVGIYKGRQISMWLESVSVFVDDKKNGPEIHFNERGNVRCIENYTDDKLGPVFTYYGVKGQLDRVSHCAENGNYEGLSIIYGDSSGSLKTPHYEFFKDGSSMSEGNSLEIKNTSSPSLMGKILGANRADR